MTHRSTWKKAERRIARLFGAERNALSGGNGKVSRSDTDHPHLFIEAKLRAKSPTWNLFLATQQLARKEGKLPVLALLRKGSPGALLVIHQDDLVRFAGLALSSENRHLPRRKKKFCG